MENPELKIIEQFFDTNAPNTRATIKREMYLLSKGLEKLGRLREGKKVRYIVQDNSQTEEIYFYDDI